MSRTPATTESFESSSSLRFKVVIPARYASTRLPAKPLLDLAGKPMIVRVLERAQRSGAELVLAATDHAAVQHVVEQHGFCAVPTRLDHLSGTDRLAEVATRLAWDDETIVINVQGDEPAIEPVLIAQLAQQLARSGAEMATLACRISDEADFLNPNVVKVVCAANGDALYFSRAPIPYQRDASAFAARQEVYRHIGLYAYRAGFLRTYTQCAPSPLELCESLEQLRALWHGYRISVALIDHLPPAGVDTPADAERMRQWFAAA